MSNSLSYDEQKILRDLQRLVALLGMNSGQLSIKIHEGCARVMEINQHMRLFLSPHPPCVSGPEAKEPFVEEAAKRFIRTRLGPAVVSHVGDFGRLEGEVQNGIVTQADLVRKIKNKSAK